MRGLTVATVELERSSTYTSVITPQAVLLQFRTAGLGSRVLAKLIDLAIQVVLLIVVAIVSGVLPGSAGFISGAVGIFLVLFAYPASEAFTSGQTLGKKALSIRVITADGGPIRFRHGVVRSLIGFFEFLIVPGGAVALICTLFTRRSQRVGDLVAETVVVREKNDPTYPLFFNPPPGAEQVALSLDTTRLSHPQYGLLREFVVRSWEMTPEARQKVAIDLSDRLFNLGIRRPPSIPAEIFVSAVAFAHQRRFAGVGGPVGLALPTMATRNSPLVGQRGGPPPAPMGPPVNLPPPQGGVPGSGAMAMNHPPTPGPPRA